MIKTQDINEFKNVRFIQQNLNCYAPRWANEQVQILGTNCT